MLSSVYPNALQLVNVDRFQTGTVLYVPSLKQGQINTDVLLFVQAMLP